ncbi:plasmid maintenance system killer [Leptonema illini DSM 21528]|uniref:Plasmid maintenance system killer n=1 Tax=Leptonema illini DSM 21528 TaxID=929563 RepID=H2CGJ5_9LEPT|nr:plasmid maintenance system killer [Leptonema illini DSM 21528]
MTCPLCRAHWNPFSGLASFYTRKSRLKGNRRGQYSIRINDQWRICFKFSEGNAFDVSIEDYH